jgi:HK97 family phage major capsid protein/HK97 family phage prohead protease
MRTATRKYSIDEIRSKPDLLEGRFDRATAKEEARTVELSFSSEEPVLRWYGWEILSHEKGAVNMERLASGRANVLVNHGPGDWVGVVESARIGDDKKGRATVRFGSGARASEVFRDVRDGILTSVSVGYRRDEMKLTRQKEGEEDEYTITRWTPYEVSLVTVPADAEVGVGRASEHPRQPAAPAAQRKETSMKTEAELAAEAEAAEKAEKAKRDKEAREAAERAAREALASRSAVDLENGRKRAIENLAKANRIPDNVRDAWINQGYELEAVSNDILNILEERGRTNPQPGSRLGLTPTETQRFSLARAILACKDNDWKNAGFELECSRAVAQRLGKVAEPTKFYVPFEAMERQHDQLEVAIMRQKLGLGLSQRDLTVATAGAGGFLVGTENMGFIEMLRNRSVAFRMGVRRLSGLQGSVTVPRQSAAATAVWLANEASTITESQQTFVQMALSPKNVGAYTEISRQLLLQSSPGAEGIVTDDLAQVVAIAADLAVLEGSGASGQPTGIANTAGIGSVTGTSLAYAGVLEFQTDVAASNVTPARGGYVTTPAVAALLMGRQRFSSTDTPLWVGNIWDGQVSGFPAMSSNQLTAASLIFGDWQETVVGEWGVLEVEVNPYANFQAGIIGVRSIYSMDVGVRRPFAYSRSTSIT